MRVTNKDIKEEDKLCMKSPPKEEGIVQRVFFKFIPLFLVLTYQMIYQYPRSEPTWGKLNDTTFEIP